MADNCVEGLPFTLACRMQGRLCMTLFSLWGRLGCIGLALTLAFSQREGEYPQSGPFSPIWHTYA